MAVKAKGQITLSSVVDVSATYRYYLLQSSTLTKPTKPTTYPPSSSWDDTEPTYTAGSTNSLYTVDCTVFSDGTFAYSAVSLSSSYEAAKAAYNKATAAQSSVTTLTTRVTDAETAITNTNTQLAAKASKTEVTQAIDNLQIGGSNLLIKRHCDSVVSDEWTELTMAASSSLTQYGTAIKLEAGETYTFSIEVEKVSEDTNPVTLSIGAGKTERKYNKDLPSWAYKQITFGEKFIATYTMPQDTIDQGYIYFAFRFMNSQKATTIRYRCAQLEKGNKSTAWTPSPEDIASTIEIGARNLVPSSMIASRYDVKTTSDFNLTDAYGNTFVSPTNTVSILEPATTYTIRCELELVKLSALPVLTSQLVGFALYSSSCSIDLGTKMPATTEIGTKVVIEKTFTTPAQWNGEQILAYSRQWSSADGATRAKDDVFRVTNFKIEKGNKATGWSAAPEDIEADIAETSNILHTEIVESTTNAILEADRMLVAALQSYVKTDDYGAFREEVMAELKMLADSLTLSFSTAQAATNAVNEDLQAKFNEITTYFTFDINGLLIGKVDNPYKMVLSNERYSMTVNGEEVMYIDAVTKMAYFPKLTITDAFVMLGYKFEHGGVEGLVNVDWIGGV